MLFSIFENIVNLPVLHCKFCMNCMSLFDFIKKKPVAPKARVEMRTYEPTKKEMEVQWKQETQERIRNFQKDAAGLYPQEILMLSYAEKYALGKPIARFWEREYGVEDVPALLAYLESNGFLSSGKLTDAGKREIRKNEYVLYMHSHKNYEISMARMSILVNKNPQMTYRDIIWGELNRLSLEHIKNHQWALYRNTKYSMYKFLLEEKRNADAFPILSEVAFYDLNGNDSFFDVAPALIEDLRAIERKLDYTDEKMIDLLLSLFDGIYAPYRNFTNDEVACVIVAYCFGNDEMAEEIIGRRKKR